jgi:hypothetical protein
MEITAYYRQIMAARQSSHPNPETGVPFNREFCAFLAFRLAFDQPSDAALRGFWCDGIDHLPGEAQSLSTIQVEKHRQIKTRAWMGKDGQGEYEMTIHLGDAAIEHYKNNKSLVACIPENPPENWVEIDLKAHTVQVYLL